MPEIEQKENEIPESVIRDPCRFDRNEVYWR